MNIIAITKCFITSHHITSTSHHIKSHQIKSYIIPYHMSYHIYSVLFVCIMSYLILYHIISYHIKYTIHEHYKSHICVGQILKNSSSIVILLSLWGLYVKIMKSTTLSFRRKCNFFHKMELDCVWINNTDVKVNDLGHISTLIVLI